MSESKAKGRGSAPSEAELPFEEALAKLETIVEEMERGELPLEKLLSRYEEGTRLARVCQTKLNEAELKLQRLEQTADGQFQLQPVQTTDPAD